MTVAEGAVIIDSSDMTINEVVDKIIEYIDLLRKLPFISLINGSLCVIVLCGIDKFGTFFKK